MLVSAARNDSLIHVKRRSALGSMLFGCGGLFATTLAAGFGYLAWANAPLPPPERDPPIRYPNAYYAWVKTVANRPLSSWKSPLGKPDSSPLVQLRQQLAKPDPAAEKIRATLTSDYWNPPIRDYDTMLPELAQYREIARRWTATARVARVDGNCANAVEQCLDAMELGGRIPHGGGIIHHLVGIACQTMPIHQAELSIPRLSPAEATLAGKRLDRIIAQAAAPAEAIDQDRRAALATVRAHFSRRNALDNPMGSRFSHPMMMAFYPKAQVYRSMDAHYRATMDELRKPYPARVRIPEPRDVFSGLLIPDVRHFSAQCAIRDAALALLRLELALHAYRARRGSYPARLEQLAPAFLHRIPLDPLTGKPFRYRLTDRGYLLYSIGTDGVDDGGRPVSIREARFSRNGDLVAGKLKEKD